MLTILQLSDGRTLQIHSTRDVVEVTSLCRPDPSWVMRDSHGHEHRWWEQARTSDSGHLAAPPYNPEKRYYLPTLTSVEVGVHEDGEPICGTVCAQCGERVYPGTAADETRVYRRVPGTHTAWIDGQMIAMDEAATLLRGMGIPLPAGWPDA